MYYFCSVKFNLIYGEKFSDEFWLNHWSNSIVRMPLAGIHFCLRVQREWSEVMIILEKFRTAFPEKPLEWLVSEILE